MFDSKECFIFLDGVFALSRVEGGLLSFYLAIQSRDMEAHPLNCLSTRIDLGMRNTTHMMPNTM